MPTSLITGLIIGAAAKAGTDIYSAHQGAKAADKAAAQQQVGVKEARAYVEPIYQQARDLQAQTYAQGQAGLAPYTQQGTAGLTALSAFLGVPQNAPTGAAAPTAIAPRPAMPSPVTTPPPMGRGAPSLEQPARPGAPATQSSYVLLRAPTGETATVPPDQAAFFLARGATKV